MQDGELRHYAAAGMTVVMWASAFAAIRVALEGYSPQSLALLRYLTASAVLVVYALLSRMPLPAWRDVPGIAVLGFFGFTVYNIALNAGEMGVSAGVASFIIASAPIYIVIMATIFFGERLRGLGWLGITVAFVGVSLISVATETGWRVNAWALLVLVAALAQSVYSVGQKPYLRRYSALQFTTYAIWSGTVFMLIFVPGLLQDMQTASRVATASVVYMGIFPGALGYIGWSYVLSQMSASVAASFLYLVPAFAVVIAWLWIGEIPGVLSFVGGALIIAGVVTVNRYGR